MVVPIWDLDGTPDLGDIVASSSLVLPLFIVRVFIACVDSVPSFIIYSFVSFYRVGIDRRGEVCRFSYVVVLGWLVMRDFFSFFQPRF